MSASKRNFSWWNVLWLGGLFAFGVAVAVYNQPPRIQPLTLKTLDGTAVDLPGQSLSWVNFWSINCPPCLKEMPYLETLHQEYQGELQIVGISVPYDPPNLVHDYRSRQQLTLPLALDIEGIAMREFTDNLVVPSHYLLDEKGNILLTHLGELDEQSIRNVIDQHL